jgi:hypothetical protein
VLSTLVEIGLMRRSDDKYGIDRDIHAPIPPLRPRLAGGRQTDHRRQVRYATDAAEGRMEMSLEDRTRLAWAYREAGSGPCGSSQQLHHDERAQDLDDQSARGRVVAEPAYAGHELAIETPVYGMSLSPGTPGTYEEHHTCPKFWVS